MVLLRDEGQVRGFGYRLELSRPRSLSGPQALRQAMGTPRQDASCSPIDLRVVSSKPRVAQNDRGEGAGNHQEGYGLVVIPRHEQVERNGAAFHPCEGPPVQRLGLDWEIEGNGVYLQAPG